MRFAKMPDEPVEAPALAAPTAPVVSKGAESSRSSEESSSDSGSSDSEEERATRLAELQEQVRTPPLCCSPLGTDRQACLPSPVPSPAAEVLVCSALRGAWGAGGRGVAHSTFLGLRRLEPDTQEHTGPKAPACLRHSWTPRGQGPPKRPGSHTQATVVPFKEWLQAPRSLAQICSSPALFCLSLPDTQNDMTCFEDQPKNMNYFPRGW